MQWLVMLPSIPAFVAAFERNLPISFLPKGARQYHIGLSVFLWWLIARKNGALGVFISLSRCFMKSL